MKPILSIKFEDIIDIVCANTKTPKERVFITCRKHEIVYTRQLIMYFARRFNLGSEAVIGGWCGDKDHATVNHAVKTINNYIDTDPLKAEQIKNIELLITGYTPPDLKTINKKLRQRIKELEDQVFRLESRLFQVRQPKESYVQPFHGYRVHQL